MPQRENTGVPERAKEGTRSLIEGSDIVLNADYYLTTTAKTPGSILLQGLRGFLINHRKFVQHPPNPCAETACSLRPCNSDSKGRWFESSRAYHEKVLKLQGFRDFFFFCFRSENRLFSNTIIRTQHWKKDCPFCPLWIASELHLNVRRYWQSFL